jgi:ABC transporter family protein
MIEARNLVKRYGSAMAVNDLSFSVRPGMVTGFLGPNGAGKTTTMRMILGLGAPTQGSVTVGGRSYRDLPAPMREVGALLDARALHGGRRAFDHLLCLAHSNGIARSRVDEVLRIVGLEGVARRRGGRAGPRPPRAEGRVEADARAGGADRRAGRRRADRRGRSPRRPGSRRSPSGPRWAGSGRAARPRPPAVRPRRRR